MRFNDGLHPASIVQAPKYVLTLAVKQKIKHYKYNIKNI